ncbi:MAG: hypothetical protein ABI667_03495 [Sphingomicrobium sp.]
MRLMIPVTALSFLLAACGSDKAAKDPRQVDQALAADDLQVNDLTAIDAISGADANMAADVDRSKWDESEEDGNLTGDSTSTKSKALNKKTTSPEAKSDEAKPAEATPAPADGANRTD